mgnify:CR=1 FL=1
MEARSVAEDRARSGEPMRWRLWALLADAEAIHGRAVALLTPPSRCEAEGRVVGTPVVQRGSPPARDSELDRKSVV